MVAGFLTVVMACVPVSPAVADVMAAELRPASAVEADEQVGPGELSGEQVEQLGLPAEPAEETPVSELPDGDFSDLLELPEEPEPVKSEPLPEAEEPTQFTASEVREAEALPVSAADEFSTTYQREDGSLVQRVSAHPINAVDESGESAVAYQRAGTVSSVSIGLGRVDQVGLDPDQGGGEADRCTVVAG
ncbi:hypothetical protein, partial [Microbacterium aurantiacum]